MNTNTNPTKTALSPPLQVTIPLTPTLYFFFLMKTPGFCIYLFSIYCEVMTSWSSVNVARRKQWYVDASKLLWNNKTVNGDETRDWCCAHWLVICLLPKNDLVFISPVHLSCLEFASSLRGFPLTVHKLNHRCRFCGRFRVAAPTESSEQTRRLPSNRQHKSAPMKTQPIMWKLGLTSSPPPLVRLPGKSYLDFVLTEVLYLFYPCKMYILCCFKLSTPLNVFKPISVEARRHRSSNLALYSKRAKIKCTEKAQNGDEKTMTSWTTHQKIICLIQSF